MILIFIFILVFFVAFLFVEMRKDQCDQTWIESGKATIVESKFDKRKNTYVYEVHFDYKGRTYLADTNSTQYHENGKVVDCKICGTHIILNDGGHFDRNNHMKVHEEKFEPVDYDMLFENKKLKCAAQRNAAALQMDRESGRVYLVDVEIVNVKTKGVIAQRAYGDGVYGSKPPTGETIRLMRFAIISYQDKYGNYRLSKVYMPMAHIGQKIQMEYDCQRNELLDDNKYLYYNE